MVIWGFCSWNARTWLSKNCPLVPLMEYQTFSEVGARGSDDEAGAGDAVA